jgi:hypothetical protein
MLISVVWLVGNLAGLYADLALISPLLAKLVLGSILLLILILVAALFYYSFLFFRPKRKAPVIKSPERKAEAAEASLKAIRQQIEKIQDEVARQSLLRRSDEIETGLDLGNFHIVVFGVGSAGKTSLVNAILGRIAGEVGAALGTTVLGQTYEFQLRGFDRQIWITDTPGILEPGIAGTAREQMARQLATEADLLLFVVDNDLRQSEYFLLRQLVDVGKRSLLVFNKIDLYTEADTEILLHQLRSRGQSFIAPEDVVAVAARPQSVVLENGDRIQPEPQILPLLRRIATVLRFEGEELMADNWLMQSLRLEAEARKLIDSQRQQQAEAIVERYQWIGAGVVSLTPLPVVDLLATAAVNTQMVIEIARVYGCELNVEQGKELALSLAKTLISLGVVRGAVEILSIALQTNISTFLVGRAIQGVVAAYLTWIAGKSFIEYFRNEQDWGDSGITEVIQEQFRLNQRGEFVKAFVQEAIARVVKPLTEVRFGSET